MSECLERNPSAATAGHAARRHRRQRGGRRRSGRTRRHGRLQPRRLRRPEREREYERQLLRLVRWPSEAGDTHATKPYRIITRRTIREKTKQPNRRKARPRRLRERKRRSRGYLAISCVNVKRRFSLSRQPSSSSAQFHVCCFANRNDISECFEKSEFPAVRLDAGSI